MYVHAQKTSHTAHNSVVNFVLDMEFGKPLLLIVWLIAGNLNNDTCNYVILSVYPWVPFSSFYSDFKVLVADHWGCWNGRRELQHSLLYNPRMEQVVTKETFKQPKLCGTACMYFWLQHSVLCDWIRAVHFLLSRLRNSFVQPQKGNCTSWDSQCRECKAEWRESASL